MYVLVSGIKLNSYVVHMFYEWSFSNNKSAPIAIKYNKYYNDLDTYNTVFDWVAGNSYKKGTYTG